MNSPLFERHSLGEESQQLVAVAVPVPLFTALTYSVPAGQFPVVGGRVKVTVGRRKLTGVVLELDSEPPAKGKVRDLETVVDEAPVLTPGLLELATFIADYYLAPIGDVVRAMLPSDLKPWGRQKLRLSDRGAMAQPSVPHGRSLIELLLLEGPLPFRAAAARLQLSATELEPLVDELQRRGVLASEESRRGGARFKAGVELIPRPKDEQIELCGRSVKAREVVEFLSEAGRAARVDEVTQAVGCGAQVVRRLVKLGVLRTFTEVQHLDLDRHVMGSVERAQKIVLRPDQRHASQRIIEGLDRKSFGAFLLSGMTGSGKTEVYLRAITRTLEQGRSAVVMVPEIALVPALARELSARYGRQLAILHSNLGKSERQQEWERVRRGEARVVVGPRSALFAPTDDLGLIVVDEEQDSSFKQDKAPRYHGRDLAMVRARACGAVAVVASATPSLETRYNVERSRYQELELTQRAGHGRLPEGQVVDLRTEPTSNRPGEIHFSAPLIEHMHLALQRKEQIILLRNRRGYAPLFLCRACGEDFRCEDCGLPRTLHRRERTLICHYCGSSVPEPTSCPECGEEALEPVGSGTERVEEDLRVRFPDIPIGVLDRDVARRPGGAAAVLERFGRGETQILVGTQMVSKGHHFPNVSLTGVLSADTYLGFPDFRAVERTYSLLTQLAGRAGRGEIPGRVLIQTYHPDHYAVRTALTADDSGFVQEEMRFRKGFGYPPFTRMVLLLLRSADRNRGVTRISDLAARIRKHPRSSEFVVTGPAPAPLERLRGQWRFQLILRARSGKLLREVVREVALAERDGDLSIDVDPYDLM